MDDFIKNAAIGIPGFLLAIVCHEFAHAWMAKKFGDNTAEASGRLTLNPSVHIDPLGTIVFPLIGAMIGGIMFGWAKPVPVNSRNFKDVKKGIFWVSFAGPGMNIILGFLSAFLLALFMTKIPNTFFLRDPMIKMFHSSIYINLVLAVFNLIPFPPLDGSKMVSTFMDYETARKYEDLARYSFFFFLGLMLLSHLGLPIFNYLLYPAIWLAEVLKNGFLVIFGMGL